MLCNGSAVSRTTYADLFAKIGTLYGTGDGSTTFTLPNLANKFIMGHGTAGTVKAAGLPNITGSFSFRDNNNAEVFLRIATAKGCFSTTSVSSEKGDIGGASTESGGQVISMSAKTSNSIYGASTTVQPPALTMRMYIKY